MKNEIPKYNPKEIEPKWQEWWKDNNTYVVDINSSKPKYMASGMFNYPSGDGIHVGHAYTFTIPDVLARFKRQMGFESLNPVGWDSFGLPAENYAIKVGVSPQESMATIIPNYRKQYTAMGWGVDWTKEITSSEPIYYKWTQWIFSQMHKNGLAYQEFRMQWWCNQCQTVLANEQVIDGKCWRHDKANDPIIEKKEVKQWFFKITEYADELLAGVDDLNWTESVKTAQKNWIGRSVGAEVKFELLRPERNSGPHDMARSYIMGVGDISEKLTGIGVTIVQETDEGNLLVEFPKNIAPIYEELIRKELKPGFWNEYLADEVVFTFCDKESNLLRFVWAPQNEQKLLKLCNQYASANFTDIRTMLESNSWYENWVSDQDTSGTKDITVFTTRADTLFGATFLVLAPEHELVRKITLPEHKEQVEAYVAASILKTEVERQAAREKTGVFTGAYAINPVNGEQVPIWVADYVLVGYGTGAIMAVPAHDERDNEFAKKFNLPIKQVVMLCEADAGNPPQAEFEEVVRDTVIVHLRDKSTGKYALLDWHGTLEGITTAIMGGIEDDQTPEAAVLAEIEEEAGLENVRIIKQLEWLSGATYCASHKKQNRKAIARGFLAEIESLEGQREVSDYEKATHTLVWVDENEVLERLVPAHQKFVWQQLQQEGVYTSEGILINSDSYNDLDSSIAREKIVADLARRGLATEKVNYKMRDWSVSRQRYWGAPIPIVNCEKCGAVLVPDDQLPVELPELTDFQPSGDGRSALARATEWLKTTCPECGGPAERETDTLDTYICSSWYLYRYIDPTNEDKIFNSELVNKWFPIDFYDGADHATAHLLYARFIGRFFNKIGIVDNPEPLGEMLYHGKILGSDGSHFSKSAGNGVDPLEVINSGYGADALRTYLMFAAPPGENIRWNQQGVPGAYRFLTRLWAIVKEYAELAESDGTDDGIDKELRTAVNVMIRKLTEDIQASKTNTAVAGLMECLNALYKVKAKSFTKSDVWQFSLESIVACVAPFAPHIAEELWQDLGHTSSVHKDSWPKWDDAYLVSDTVTIVVQVNGKLRGEFSAAAGAGNDGLEAEARKVATEKGWLDGEPKKVIVVPGKLVNIVI